MIHGKMKLTVWCTLVVAMGLFLFWEGRTPHAVAAEQSLISAAEIDYPPFSIVDEQGRATGFSVELMRAALATMGRTVTFRTGPWGEVKAWLENGEIQALPLVGRTPEREQIFDFTFPYMSFHGALVVREDTVDVDELADLTGRKVAVMKGDNTEEYLRRNDYGVEIVTTQTFETALRQLSEGRHDAVFIQRLVALRLINEAGLTNLRIVNQPVADFSQEFCFAVAEGDRKTLALLNEGLSLVIADGTYRYLHAQWFSAMELPSHRKIIVGGDHNYPPYEYLDENGQPAGYNVDLTRAIAAELGLNIQIKLGPWTQIVAGLQTGEIDILQGMFYSPERGLTFDFTPSHAVNHCVSVGRKSDGPPPETIDELAVKQIVVQQGDIMHEFTLQKGLKDQTSAVDSQEAALMELVEGKHDCALVSRLTALYLIQKHGWSQLVIGKTPFLSPEYCFAAPHNRKALLAQFSEGLGALERTGEYRRIQEKWMGVDDQFSHQLTRTLQYAGVIIGTLVIILLGVFLWSWMLRRQVAARTEDLRKSQELQKAMIACSPVALYSIDFKGVVLTWNASAERIFGWRAQEVIGKPLPIIPDRQYEEFNELRRQVENQISFVGKEVVRMKKDGTLFDGSLSVAPILDADGRVIGIMGAMEEITLRKESERKLKDQNRFIQTILDHLPIGLAVNDIDQGRARYINPAFEKIYGWPREAIENVAEFFEKVYPDPHYREQIQNQIMADIESGDMERMQWENIEATGQDGTKRIIKARNIPLIEQNLMISTVQDITESRNLQDQLVQAQKMESVGRLAGGVAHDFNNMLTIILNFTQMIMDDINAKDPVHKDLQQIFNAATRAADITRQLLAFARRQTISPQVVDLNAVVEQILKMLRRLIGEDINLLWKPAENLWPVKIDPTQVDQILANLCVNARDAISGVGKITIETDMVTFDHAYCENHLGFAPGDFVVLAASDDGCGMDKKIMSNLFEPFFTTKSVGKGTGLGLATVYGIVKQNNGFINTYSEPGQGTTFRIYLPRHVGKTEPVSQTMPVDVPKGKGETILVVEDETAIINLLKTMLTKLEYTVLAAATPAEAMQMTQQYSGRIHLMITDVVMPEMNGRDLAEKMIRLYPGIKVLFMSGYTANVIAHQGVLDEGVNFIQKPFSMETLAGMVRQAIEDFR